MTPQRGPERAVFIAGLTHSGSTLLDFTLGTLPNFIGLGEVSPLLHPASKKLFEPSRICSCGEPVTACEYWSEVIRRLDRQEPSSWVDRYRLAYAAFYDVFGRDRILVDSSKSARALRMAASLGQFDFHVVHLVRDVRSWTVSRLDVDRRRRLYDARDLAEKFGRKAWRPLLLRGPLARFVLWHRGNRKIETLIEELGPPAIRLSYEQLALDTDATLRALFAFLGSERARSRTPFTSEMESRSHIALGNRMRLQTESRRRIRYDMRWFARREWLLPSLLLPRVSRYNDRITYSPPSTREPERAFLPAAHPRPETVDAAGDAE